MNKLLFPILFVATTVFAADTQYNQINFEVSSERSIANDLLKVDMYLKEQDKDARQVAKRINQKMQQAFKLINQYPTIKNKTGSYNIHPRYKKSNIIGWDARQDVHLESTNIEELSDLMQKLQSTLLVSNTHFTISKPLRKKVKAELLLTLLDKFRIKANLIREKLGAKDYKIVRLNINEKFNSPTQYQYSQIKSKAYFSTSSRPEPKLAAGEGELSSNLSATLEFSF